MIVSGFTIIRNGVLYAYPFKESILSILPLCDEMIINVGKSSDNTLEVIRSINDKRIKIFESEWDMSLTGGKVLSVETNKALKKCTGDWCFYIQGDEVLHEKYSETVRDAMIRYSDNKRTEGLKFRYEHFYGSYNYVQDNYRNWYFRETRIIKNSVNIVSWGDAMDFRHKDGSKLRSKDIKAKIYHYGWVRPPLTLIQKRRDFEKIYTAGEEAKRNILKFENYDDMGNLRKFTETHPLIMTERVLNSNWDFDAKIDQQKPDWLRKILIFMHPLIKRIKKIHNKNKS